MYESLATPRLLATLGVLQAVVYILLYSTSERKHFCLNSWEQLGTDGGQCRNGGQCRR